MKSFFLLTLIILSLLSSCYKKKEEVRNKSLEKLDLLVIKENFAPVLNNFIGLLKNEQSDDNIIIVICYSVFDHECILIANDFGYDSTFLRGYTEYKNSLICYYGVDDGVAEKILYCENLKKDIPNKKYDDKKKMENLGDIIFDPIGGYYLLDHQDNISSYEPSLKTKEELEKLAIQHGFVPVRPPLP